MLASATKDVSFPKIRTFPLFGGSSVSQLSNYVKV